METQSAKVKEVDIQQVWEHYFKHRDIESRNLLLLHYLPLAKYTADRLYPRFPKCIELDDLYSAGIMGLIDAIEKFDPKENTRFETYSVQRIEGEIRDDIRRRDWVSRLVRNRAKKHQEVTQKLEAILGRYPTDEELADELKMTKDQFYCFQRDANAGILFSLNTHLSNCNGNFTELQVIADRKTQSPFSEVCRQDFRDFMKRGLAKEEQIILILYYFEQMTMKEIGESLNLSESRVCQMHTSIIARLRSRVNRSSLCPV